MLRTLKTYAVVPLLMLLVTSTARAGTSACTSWLAPSNSHPQIERFKKTAVSTILDVMAYQRGLPRYRDYIKESRVSGSYLEHYDNFGEMGLAEFGISVRYNQAALAGLNTGRPLIIVANHHLGIADGLALQYLASRARTNYHSVLFLARWIEELLPHAVFGDEPGWGTAIPVDISESKPSNPNNEARMAEKNRFNAAWLRPAARALRLGAAGIVMPLGHVAGIEAGGTYPTGVRDPENSWQPNFLGMARLAKADIVFANVDSVNSEAFYRDRKRYGGGDKERVIWFLSEAIAKRGQVLDVYFSAPRSLDDVLNEFARTNPHSRADLDNNDRLVAELMRRETYKLPRGSALALDHTDTPAKVPRPTWAQRRPNFTPVACPSPGQKFVLKTP